MARAVREMPVSRLSMAPAAARAAPATATQPQPEPRAVSSSSRTGAGDRASPEVPRPEISAVASSRYSATVTARAIRMARGIVRAGSMTSSPMVATRA